MLTTALGFTLAHLIVIVNASQNVNETIARMALSVVLAFACFIFFWSLTGLFAYHTYLSAQNITTHEKIRQAWGVGEGARHPYDTRNWISNWKLMLCRPQPYVADADVAIGGARDDVVIDMQV